MYKYNKITDKGIKFNIDKALNENLDKIDETVGTVKLVKLNSEGKIPNLNASLLTNVPHTRVDYASGTTLSSVPYLSTPFVAPSDGIYVFFGYITSKQAYLYINNINTGIIQSAQDGYTANRSSLIVPLSFNDSIYWDNTFSSSNVLANKFYPYKV